MRILPLALIAVLAACEPVVEQAPVDAPRVQQQQATPKLSTRAALANFNRAKARVEPVAEQVCRQRAPNLNCDFRIIIDERSGQGINAYQTLDRSGRPIIGFTVPLIADARNQDEIAFVMAHEAAHHIQGHIARQQQNATVGAIVFGQLAGALGAPNSIDTAQQIGATVGARTYSKEFELEADALGTRIAAASGYDPLKGAQFFFRIPDPGNRFLGTHPANADRLRTVERVAAGL
ncbi:M48 family metallopeptidase [Yoonia sp. 2307UL14-13]|uniref:M48 family metallopeptidase n=1 Tax=Yoonia sp. 2307UL14-13 TaxID=3126506 RepID=UPI00309C1B19